MKIKSVRARVFQWKGKTVPPQGNFCSNAMDLVYSNTESMSTFRFHSWTVVEIETDDGIVGIGNVALAPAIAKAIIDQLRTLGYKGPDFGPSDPGLQERKLIVLEAPEEFAPFAKSRGWKNLAEEFDDE